MAEALADGLADGPLEPLFERVFSALGELPRLLVPEREELQRRCTALLDAGDDATLAARAVTAFADHGPAWPFSVFHSTDVQLAAADLAAIEGGEYPAVVGDFHAGNPLTQGVFSTRFPDPARFRALCHPDIGQPFLAPIRRLTPNVRITARNNAEPTGPDDMQRRATWRARAADRPTHTSGIAAWAAELGLPRRMICLAAGQAKPIYVDFESPALTRNLHRILGHAASTDPQATVRISEMLPRPDQCWLEHNGQHFTSELRIVAVDQTRRRLGHLSPD